MIENKNNKSFNDICKINFLKNNLSIICIGLLNCNVLNRLLFDVIPHTKVINNVGTSLTQRLSIMLEHSVIPLLSVGGAWRTWYDSCFSGPELRHDVGGSIGLDGLLGTEALQSCLPRQLDLCTGQLWVDGRSTLQLHQQCQAARASAHLTTSVVLPPDSEVVAPVSVSSPTRDSAKTLFPRWTVPNSDGGLRRPRGPYPGGCVIMVRQRSDGESKLAVLPFCLCVGELVPASVVSVARLEPEAPRGGGIILILRLVHVVFFY